MGDVAITFKVMPEDTETDLGAIEDGLKAMGAKQIKISEVAFGLKALEALFVVPDKEGSDLEEKISAIPGVGSVETAGITLV